MAIPLSELEAEQAITGPVPLSDVMAEEQPQFGDEISGSGLKVALDEMPEEFEPFRTKIENSLYYSQQFGIPAEMAFDMEPNLNKQAFGKTEVSGPGKLFLDSFKQSLADKPAMILRGLEVYTPGKGLGADYLLDKAATFLDSLKDKETEKKLQEVAAGKLWPIGEGKRFWQVEAKHLPEVINSWSVNVADQIPIMLTTIAGRMAGKVLGKPIGAAAGAAAALVTGGPDPSDVATAPAVTAVTSEVVKHLGGAAPLVAMESGGYMDEAKALGIDDDIAEKYARLYGPASGLIEYAQWLWVLGRYSKITKPIQDSILKTALKHLGGSAFEGVEEVTQEALQNKLLQKAVEEMKARHPEYQGVAPGTFEGVKRAGAIGTGVAFLTGLPGTSMTMAQGRQARQQQTSPETKKFLGEPSVAELQEAQAAEEEAEQVKHLASIAAEAKKEAEPTITPVEPKIIAPTEKVPSKPQLEDIPLQTRDLAIEMAKKTGQNQYIRKGRDFFRRTAPPKTGDYWTVTPEGEITFNPTKAEPKPKIPPKPAKAGIKELQSEILAREADQTDEQLSGITKRRRGTLAKQTAEKIKGHDIYQDEVAAQAERGQQIGPGFYFVHESGRGEVEAALENIPKGPLRTKIKKMFTFKRDDLLAKGGSAIAWDVAAQEGLMTETEQQAEIDLSQFVQRVADSVTQEKRFAGLNERALNAFAESGFPEAEMLSEKFRMLKRGSSDIEINEMITEWAQRNDIPIETVIDEFVNADKMKKIAELSEEEQEAEIERLATEQILAEDQIAAQSAAIDVLEANDIEAEVRTVEDIQTGLAEERAKDVSRGVFGQEVLKPISGIQPGLGLVPGTAAKKEAAHKPELADTIGKMLSEPDPPVTPNDAYLRMTTRKELFNNPNNPIPEVESAWDEAVSDRAFKFQQRGRPTGAAMTQGQREVILLAMGADIETGAHEGWHLLRGRLTTRDLATLEEKYGTGIEGEENEAAAFGRFYKNDKAPSTTIRKIFEKIRKILAKIKAALQGKGFRTVDDIFTSAKAGTIEKQIAEEQAQHLKSTAIEAKKPGPTIYHRGDTGAGVLKEAKRTKGLIALTKDIHVAESYIRGGVPQTEEEFFEQYESEVGQKEHREALDKVDTYQVNVKNTLKIDREGLKVIGNLDNKGNRKAKAIIDNSASGDLLFWWQHTLEHKQEAWEKVLIPQLQELGYDSIEYKDDVNTGRTLSVFSPDQLELISGKIDINPRGGFTFTPTEAEPKKGPAPSERVRFETTGQRLRREAEQKARINARKARLKAQAELVPTKKKKPKKVSRARLKIKLRETTPPLSPELEKFIVPGQAFIGEEPAPGKGKTPRKVVLTEQFLEQNRQKYKKGLGEFVSDKAERALLEAGNILRAMSTQLEKIDPKLKFAVRKYAFNMQVRTIGMVKEAAPMVQAWKKFSKNDKRDFKFAALNGWSEKIQEIIEKNGAQAEYEQYRAMMDEIFRAGNEVGLEILYDAEHWPRVVKDFKGLINYLQTTDKWSPIQQALFKRQEQAGGRELTEQEKAQVINTLLRGFRIGGVTLSRPGAARERTIEVFDNRIEPYYQDFETGLQMYIQNMMQSISAREFFGKETKEIRDLRAQKARLATRLFKTSARIGLKEPITPEKHDIHISEARKKFQEVTERLASFKTQTIEDSVGWAVNDLFLAGKIDYVQQQQVAKIFRGIFEPRGMTGAIRMFTKLGYIDLLANPEVAMTQLEEMGLSFYKSKFGAVPAITKAFTGTSKIKLADLGIDDINQFMQDLGFNELGDKLLFMMRAVDMPLKEAFANTAVSVAITEAKKSTLDPKFKKLMDDMFGAEAAQTIEDLKTGIVSENVKFLAFSELAEMQPIAITETPLYYARGGNARIFYMLRSFTLRRLDMLLKKARRAAVNPIAKPEQFVKGVTDIMHYLAILTAFGIGKDVLKAWFHGQPFGEEEFWDSVVDNLLQFVLLSRWTARRAKQEGLGRAVAEEIFPPTKGIDAVIRDVKNGEINRTVRSIPLVGEPYFWWFGGGSDKTGKRTGF